MIYKDNERLIIELKKILLDENVKQKEIADRLGIKPQGLTKIINKKNFSFDDMQKILDAIGYEMIIELSKKSPNTL